MVRGRRARILADRSSRLLNSKRPRHNSNQEEEADGGRVGELDKVRLLMRLDMGDVMIDQ